MDRVNAIYQIGKKDFIRSIRSSGIYVIMFLSFLFASIMIYFVAMGVNSSVFILSRNLSFVDIIFMISLVSVSFLYLGVSSVTTIAREKRDKTIEVLFYGPVDEISFILGKFIGRILTFVFLLASFVIFFSITNFFVHLDISNIFRVSLLSIFLLSCIIALGIFLSNFTSKISISIVILIGFFIGLFLLGIIGFIIALIPVSSPAFSIVKEIIVNAIGLMNYVSPINYLMIGWNAISTNDNFKYVESIVYSAIYSSIFLVLSMLILKRRGVR